MAEENMLRPAGAESDNEAELDEVELAEEVSGSDIADVEEPPVAEGLPPREQETEEPDFLTPDEELNFTDEIGTTDAMIVVSEGEVYFPPTDPVVEPDTESYEGLEVVGGTAPTSMDPPLDTQDVPERVEIGDDEIAQHVYTELDRDAMTTDLRIKVFVRNGVVHLHGVVNSLEEAEAAEEVAARAPGVVEVIEELNVVPQSNMTEEQRDRPWRQEP